MAAIEPEEKDKAAALKLAELLRIMAMLRDPASGCPWDLKQTFETIAPYTIEEAYEVADSIERGDAVGLKDELGDLLLQVVYHARMAEEAGLFEFAGVTGAICDKMIRRHPHVFGGGKPPYPGQWEAIKEAERSVKASGGETPSLFDGVAAGLPALLRSEKLQRRAARIGFDWPSVEPILDKLQEELSELKAEMAAPESEDKAKRQFEEFGDLMFVMVNLGLRLGVNAEQALRAANAKFMRRMRSMTQNASEAGLSLEGMTLDEMQALWDRAKAEERG